MPDYSIFVLGESRISISGGGQLDGITQGTGEHLQGRTITLNANDWTEVRIRDNDGDFGDSDSSQRLDGNQVIDGTAFGDGTVVEAEYGLTLSDGVDTWQVVGFNVNNSSPSYATVEGLAFIGGPGGFPPIGVPLTVVSYQEGPNFGETAYATPICYGAGTLIDTETGPRPIETIRPDDLVTTRDHGLQPVRWTGCRHVIGVGRFAPVEFAAGVLGAHAPLLVSQNHRMLLAHPQAELLFGHAEVFVQAVHLVDGLDIRVVDGPRIAYHHLALDRHEVICANGVASESLFSAADLSDDPGRSFFADPDPGLLDDPRLARRSLRSYETRLLLRRIGHRQTPPLRLIA